MVIIIIRKKYNMSKRLFRNDVSPITREKQSVAHKGRKHSSATKNKISLSLQKYWSGLETKPTDNNTTSTTDTIYGKNKY